MKKIHALRPTLLALACLSAFESVKDAKFKKSNSVFGASVLVSF